MIHLDTDSADTDIRVVAGVIGIFATYFCRGVL